MHFTKLKLDYFGRFQNRLIELKPGINLIYGDNEAGKSTIHTFIRGMLFGIERLRGRGSASKEDVYSRYLPWDYPGAYGGSLDIEIGGKEYRLQRSFHANDKSFVIMDLLTGREVKLKEDMISELVPGLTEAAFKNTISIEQLKARTDSELASNVRNYIANMSISKSKEVNVAKALSILMNQRKQLEFTLSMSELNVLRTAIEEGLAKEERMEELTVKLLEFKLEEKELSAKMAAAETIFHNEAAKKMEQLPAIVEKYHAYEELTRQESSLETQVRELEKKLYEGEQELTRISRIKEDIETAKMLQSEHIEQEKYGLELREQKDSLIKESRKYSFLSLIPFSILAIAIFIFTGFHPIWTTLSAAIIIAGILGYIILRKSMQIKSQILSAKAAENIKHKDEIQMQLYQILHKYKVNHLEELTRKQEEVLRDSYSLEHAKEQKADLEKRKSELIDNRDVLYETIMKYIQYFLTVEELSPKAMQELEREIQSRKREAADMRKEMNGQLDNCRLNIEKLKWELTLLESNEEELLRNKEKYKELEQQQKEASIELEAVKLALTTIQELSTDIHDSFGYQLNKSVSEVIDEVTEHKYSDLIIDEKLEVKVGWNGRYVQLDRLSAGTIDQVYFALRMAAADLLLGKDEVPLLFDDSFSLYDDSRIKAALLKLAQRKQVILFTCHKREQRLLKELKVPYHLVDLSCNEG